MSEIKIDATKARGLTVEAWGDLIEVSGGTIYGEGAIVITLPPTAYE